MNIQQYNAASMVCNICQVLNNLEMCSQKELHKASEKRAQIC